MKGTRLPFAHPANLVATWFGIGLLPVAPGTWGSLAALPAAWIIASFAGRAGLALATVAVITLGIWAAGTVERRCRERDPGRIVVDEVAGQWLALIAVPPDPVLYGASFVFFRVADIAKPWPARWIERRLRGGLAVMLDDLVAGLYAALATYLMMAVLV